MHTDTVEVDKSATMPREENFQKNLSPKGLKCFVIVIYTSQNSLLLYKPAYMCWAVHKAV